MLKIKNSFGNCDVRKGVPKGYKHIKGKRLGVLCRKLAIKYVPAFVGFGESHYGYEPILDGVVVTAKSAPKVQTALEQPKPCRPKAKPLEITPDNVSRALYIINKHAKKFGERAEKAYLKRRHLHAGKYKTQKNGLYSLKTQVLDKALNLGWAAVEAYHSITNKRMVTQSYRQQQEEDDDEEWDNEFGLVEPWMFGESPQIKQIEVVSTQLRRLIRFGDHTFHDPIETVPNGVQVVDLGEWEADSEIVGRKINLDRATDLLRRFVSD